MGRRQGLMLGEVTKAHSQSTCKSRAPPPHRAVSTHTFSSSLEVGEVRNVFPSYRLRGGGGVLLRLEASRGGFWEVVSLGLGSAFSTKTHLRPWKEPTPTHCAPPGSGSLETMLPFCFLALCPREPSWMGPPADIHQEQSAKKDFLEIQSHNSKI